MTGYRGRIARSLVNARESADVSQRELAERLGHDKRTVQKWESGKMKISMEDFLEIFDALHVAMEPYSKWIRHPELFPNGLADINKFNHDKRRSALVHYYGRQASPVEVEQEYYILFADHGSDYYGGASSGSPTCRPRCGIVGASAARSSGTTTRPGSLAP